MNAKDTHKPLWKQCVDIALEAHLHGDTAGAEREYRLAVDLAGSSDGAYSEPSAEALTVLADFLSGQKRYPEADRVYRQSIEIYDRLFGSDNVMSNMLLGVIGETYNRQESTLNTVLLHAYMLKGHGASARHYSA